MAMNPAVLASIRAKISENEISDDRVAKLLYSGGASLRAQEDKEHRARIIEALGYDPEDKWA